MYFDCYLFSWDLLVIVVCPRVKSSGGGEGTGEFGGRGGGSGAPSLSLSELGMDNNFVSPCQRKSYLERGALHRCALSFTVTYSFVASAW